MPFKKGEPRPAGAGKRKGSRNKKTVLREAAEILAKQNKKTPLEILENIANDPRTTLKLKAYCAHAAAPYVHRRMPQAVELTGSLAVKTTFEDAVKK